MRTAKVLSAKEVREIIAEHFGVDTESVIQSKYSYIIVDGKEDDR